MLYLHGIKSFLSERSVKIPLKSILADSYKEVVLTAKEFLSKKQALRVVSSVQIDTSKGNIRKRVKNKHNNVSSKGYTRERNQQSITAVTTQKKNSKSIIGKQ